MGHSIIVESHFSAAHSLKGYRGKCESVHGHNWQIQVEISGNKLDRIGMVFDFKKAKAILEDILSLLDHKQLDHIAFFKKHNPTSEFISEFIFTKYQKRLKSPFVIEKVTVWETPTSAATYSRD